MKAGTDIKQHTKKYRYANQFIQIRMDGIGYLCITFVSMFILQLLSLAFLKLPISQNWLFTKSVRVLLLVTYISFFPSITKWTVSSNPMKDMTWKSSLHCKIIRCQGVEWV